MEDYSIKMEQLRSIERKTGTRFGPISNFFYSIDLKHVVRFEL